MSVKPHILVIDDEPQILRAMRTILSAHNYRVTVSNRGQEGQAIAASEQPDLIILDLGLPDISGVEICKSLRTWTQIPIIILSVRDQEKDKVQALDAGADDYLVKPFGIEELLARIRAGLRHSIHKDGVEPVIQSGDLRIDLARHIVIRGIDEVKLTATEYKLLAYLVSHPGRVLTHQNILNHVWGLEYIDNVEYLRVYMSQLRRKLEDNPKTPKRLVSEPGVGYRFLVET